MNLSTLVVFLIVAAIFGYGLKKIIDKASGKGACCSGGGGGDVRPLKKTLDAPKLGTYTIEVKGMSCEHCEDRVQRALDKIDGLAVKKVSHKRGTALVDYSQEIDEDVIKTAIIDAGYEYVAIKKQTNCLLCNCTVQKSVLNQTSMDRR